MIAGVGIDLVDVERVAALLERHGTPFAHRILSPAEDARNPGDRGAAEFLAIRFAAKEAIMKALGTGMAGAAFRDIAILEEAGGALHVVLSGEALETARRRGIAAWRVSLTHAAGTAAAVAIALRSP